jgi:hypothetical protein
MMRFSLAFCLLFAGCVPQPTVPAADDYVPWIAVALGLSAHSPAVVATDTPSDELK